MRKPVTELMRDPCEPHHGTAAADPSISAVVKYRCFVFQVFQRACLCACSGWDNAARLDRDDPVIPFNLGNVLDELGREREAEIAYRQALARDPNFPDAWFNLGVLQEKIGREDEALFSYETAFAVEPSYDDALHNAALLLMRKRRFSAAVNVLDQLVSTSQLSSGEARRLAQLCRLELKQESARR
jgi:tetratricopeptide (TPR) repeat protein